MKLQLKRSNVLESGEAKSPTSAQLDYGELAVNYNNGDPAVFLKDSNDNVIRIAGKGATGLDGDYVNVTGDNMTGDLTFDTDKIVLGIDGSASFSGRFNVTTLSTTGDLVAQFKNEDAGGVRQSSFQYTNAGELKLYGTSSNANPTVTVESDDGSASFAGGLFSIDDAGAINTSSGLVAQNKSGFGDSAISIIRGLNTAGTVTSAIFADGHATFSGRVDAGSASLDNAAFVGLGNHATKGVIQAYHYSNGSVFLGGGSDGTTKVDIKADGSASFSGGSFQIDGSGVVQTNIKSAGDLKLDSSAGFSDPNIILKANDGSASFSGDVTANAFSGDGSGLTGVTVNTGTLPVASTTQAGIVQLTDSASSTSTTTAGTANAVKAAYDRGSEGVTNAAAAQSTATNGVTFANAAQATADAALPKAGGTITGNLTVNGTITAGGYSMASLSQL